MSITEMFSRAARSERYFECMMADSGYKRKTTFSADLAIAECYGRDEVLDTYERVMKEWLGSIKYITEFVMALNVKCWEAFEDGDDELSRFYGDLFYKAQDAVYDHYRNDKQALDYYYKNTN